MNPMPIVNLAGICNELTASGRHVSVLWQHDDTLAFVARGREYRSEFHINPSDETMYMIQGEMRLHYRTPEGKEDIAVIAQGALIYTRAGTPHSPRFPPDAFALISERKRPPRRDRQFPLVLCAVRRAAARRAIRRRRLRPRPGVKSLPAILRQCGIPNLQKVRRNHGGAGGSLNHGARLLLRQDFFNQLEDRREILVLGFGQIQIFFGRVQTVGRIDIVLGNIDAPRVMRVGAAEFLNRDLPFAGQEPVDQHLGCVGVWRPRRQT